MKGIVFSEFLELVESQFGLALADQIIQTSASSTDGAYTSVGTYDHHELLRMVSALSAATNVPPNELVKSFGKRLFGRFFAGFPVFFENATSAFEFLSSVDGYIHVEVRKLYPDAELPRFESKILSPSRMEMIYTSKRPLADLAEGLISGCADHFHEPMTISRQIVHNGETNIVRFELTRISGEK
jgi:hypothetical protein